MRSMDFFGHVVTSQASIHDQTDKIVGCFFVTRHLSGNNLHSSVSSEPLIEDKEPNLTAMHKFSYLYTYSSTKNFILGCFDQIELFRQLNL